MTHHLTVRAIDLGYGHAGCTQPPKLDRNTY